MFLQEDLHCVMMGNGKLCPAWKIDGDFVYTQEDPRV